MLKAVPENTALNNNNRKERTRNVSFGKFQVVIFWVTNEHRPSVSQLAVMIWADRRYVDYYKPENILVDLHALRMLFTAILQHP